MSVCRGAVLVVLLLCRHSRREEGVLELVCTIPCHWWLRFATPNPPRPSTLKLFRPEAPSRSRTHMEAWLSVWLGRLTRGRYE